MSYTDIISNFKPTLLPINNIELLTSVSNDTTFFVYGEVHGIRENADIVYSLANYLKIERIALENSPSVESFIDAACQGNYDLSLIDTDTFDSSILSLEMAKTILTLVNEGKIREVVYIDTYFDTSRDEGGQSPQDREAKLANNVLSLDSDMRTLCLMGQWHTQPQPVKLPKHLGNNGEDGLHYSALYRIRKVEPGVIFVHNIYRKGQLLNVGNVLTVPERSGLPEEYMITKVSDVDFDLYVPEAHAISLPPEHNTQR